MARSTRRSSLMTTPATPCAPRAYLLRQHCELGLPAHSYRPLRTLAAGGAERPARAPLGRPSTPVRPNVGRLSDFTGDWAPDPFDFPGCVKAFNAAAHSAECDNDVGLTMFGFPCFVNAFNAGCRKRRETNSREGSAPGRGSFSGGRGHPPRRGQRFAQSEREMLRTLRAALTEPESPRRAGRVSSFPNRPLRSVRGLANTTDSPQGGFRCAQRNAALSL